MTGAGGDTGRGVRAAARGLRTWRRLAGMVLAAALIGAAGAAAWKAARTTTAYQWYAIGMLVLSETLIDAGLNPRRPKEIRHPDGRAETVTLGAIASHRPLLALRDRMTGNLLDAALIGLAIGAGLAVAVLAALHYTGGRLKRGRRLRGGELVSARQLRRRLAPPRLRLPFRPVPEAPYRIAGIPWPERAETRHTLVSGTTGSGKTVLIADLVEQIRRRGERCVIYDKMGSYAETFFDPRRDVLLNPLDARAPRWSPFLEARDARDFDTMAAALIPRQKDAVDPFWITAARQLFSHGAAVFWKQGETRNRVLVEHLLKTSLDTLAEAMEGTVAQSIVDPANPKTALSVRAMLTANIGALELLPDQGDPFSIRDWIGNDGGSGFLFLTSRGDQHASLRGLISTWLEIAVNALLSLPRDDGRRIWIVLDELPTLHQLPSLRPGLAESRQFGGCFVLGVQVFSALRDLYGRDGAETVSGLCGTRVVLAAPDRDTAEWSAESLGRAEIEEMAESVNYGADTPRDGVTLGARRALRPLVLPAEVARLDSLAGYLKFPGAWPVARIALRYVKRPRIAERFVPWESKEWTVGTGEAGRGPSQPGSKTAETTPGEAEVATGQAPEAEVDLWEPDSMEAGNSAENVTSTEFEWPTEASDAAPVSPDVQPSFPFMENALDEASPDVMDADKTVPTCAQPEAAGCIGDANTSESSARPSRTETGPPPPGNDRPETPVPAPADLRESASRSDRTDEKDGDAGRRFPSDWI